MIRIISTTLEYSNEVRELLQNRHLRAMIKILHQSINPDDDMQKAMMEPIFVQLADQLLKIVENKDRC
jgi:zinc finger HIT domain-containing protein 3